MNAGELFPAYIHKRKLNDRPKTRGESNSLRKRNQEAELRTAETQTITVRFPPETPNTDMELLTIPDSVQETTALSSLS